MAVSDDEVRHVAELARLGLEPDRVAQLALELNGILAHMDALSAADTRVASRDLRESARGMPLRPDDGTSDAARDLRAVPRERMAPEMRDGFFLVPRLSTHEGAGQAAGSSGGDPGGGDEGGG